MERPVRFIEIRPAPQRLEINDKSFRLSISAATVAQDPKLRNREVVQPLTLEARPIETLPATGRYDFEMRWSDEFRPGAVEWERFWTVKHRVSLQMKPSDFASLETSLENRTRFNADGQADQGIVCESSLELRHPKGHKTRISTGVAAYTDFSGNRRGQRYARLRVEQRIFNLPIRLRITPGVIQETQWWNSSSVAMRREIENAVVWDLTQQVSLTSGVLVQEFESLVNATRNHRQQVFASIDQVLTPSVKMRWFSSYERTENGTPQPTTRMNCGVEAGWSLTERIRGAFQVLRSEVLQSPDPAERVPQILLSVSMAGSF